MAALQGEELRLAQVKLHISDLKKEFHEQQLVQHHRLPASVRDSHENSLKKKLTQAELKRLKVLATREQERQDLNREKRFANDPKFAQRAMEHHDEALLASSAAAVEHHGSKVILKERHERANTKKKGKKRRNVKRQEGLRNATIQRWKESLSGEEPTHRVSKAQRMWEVCDTNCGGVLSCCTKNNADNNG